LFIDESFRGGEGLLGFCDDLGVGLILHDLENDFGLSGFPRPLKRSLLHLPARLTGFATT